jgi:hypothetical protein
MIDAKFSITAMKAIIYASALALLGGIAPATAQVPPDRLQQFSRDLIPANSTDFWRAGRIKMEQEIRWLLEQRRLHQTEILKVNSNAQPRHDMTPSVKAGSNRAGSR